jgi:hypothetical protein
VLREVVAKLTPVVFILALGQSASETARASCMTNGIGQMSRSFQPAPVSKGGAHGQVMLDVLEAQKANKAVALVNEQGQVFAKGTVIEKDGNVFVTSMADGTTVVRPYDLKKVAGVKPVTAIPKTDVETMLGKLGQDQIVKIELQSGNQIRTVRGKISHRDGDVLVVRPTGKTASGGPRAKIEVPFSDITGFGPSRAATASLVSEGSPKLFAVSVSDAEKARIIAMGDGKTIELGTVGKSRKVGKGDEILLLPLDGKGPKRIEIERVVIDQNGIETFVMKDGRYLPAKRVSELGAGKDRPLVELRTKEAGLPDSPKPTTPDAEEIAREEARRIAEREALEKAEREKAAAEDLKWREEQAEREIKKIDDDYKKAKEAREIAEREALEKARAERLKRAQDQAEAEIKLINARNEAAKKLAQKNAATRAQRQANAAAGIKIHPTLAQFEENAIFSNRGLLPDGRPVTSDIKNPTKITELSGGTSKIHVVDQVIVDEHEPWKILGVKFKDGQLKRVDELKDWKLGVTAEEKAFVPPPAAKPRATPPPIPDAARRARPKVIAKDEVEQFYVTKDGLYIEPGVQVPLAGDRNGTVEKLIRTEKGNLGLSVKVDGTEERVVLDPSRVGSVRKAAKPSARRASTGLNSKVVPSAVAADGRLFRGGSGVAHEEATVLLDANGGVAQVTEVVVDKTKGNRILGVRTNKGAYLSARQLKKYTAVTSKMIPIGAGSTVTDTKGLMHNVDAVFVDEQTKVASTIRLSDGTLLSPDELHGYQIEIDYDGPGMPGYVPRPHAKLPKPAHQPKK